VSLFGGRQREDGTSQPAPPEQSGKVGEVKGDAGRSPTSPETLATSSGKKPPQAEGEESMANIGKSITIKGDLSGNEDLVIEGKVEGKIDLPSNRLTIGAGGQVHAQVHAKSVVVIGRVTGNVSATERLEIQASGVVEGDVRAPRLVVQEGAVLNGGIEMSNKEATPRATAAPFAPSPTVSEARKAG